MAIKGYAKKPAQQDSLAVLLKYMAMMDEDKADKFSSNMLSYNKMLTTADSPAELNNLSAILNDDIANSNGENYEEYQNIGINIQQRKDALNIAYKLPDKINKVKEEWANKNFEELTLDDVKKLKKEFDSINDQFNIVAYNYGKNGVLPPSILPVSAMNNMEFITDSYDAGIVDLMKTGKFTPDDWMILQTTPDELENIRKLRLDENKRLYNKYAPMLSNFNLVNKDQIDVAVNSKTMTSLLEPFIKDAITGEINELEYSTLNKAIETGDRLGVEEFVNRKRAEVKQIVKSSYEQLGFWGEKGQSFTGNETTDEKNNILKLLATSNNVSISEEYINKDGNFEDNLGKVHQLIKNEDNTYKISTAPKDRTITINNANSLPEIGMSLWNNLDEFAGNTTLKDEDVEILNERGFGSFIKDNAGGHSVTTFMKQLKNLNEKIKDSKSKKIEIFFDKSKKTIDLGEDWDGLKDIDDFKQLSEILKSQKYKIDNMWNSNIYSKGFNNLESNLYRTSSK